MGTETPRGVKGVTCYMPWLVPRWCTPTGLKPYQQPSLCRESRTSLRARAASARAAASAAAWAVACWRAARASSSSFCARAAVARSAAASDSEAATRPAACATPRSTCRCSRQQLRRSEVPMPCTAAARAWRLSSHEAKPRSYTLNPSTAGACTLNFTHGGTALLHPPQEALNPTRSPTPAANHPPPGAPARRCGVPPRPQQPPAPVRRAPAPARAGGG